MYSTPDQHTNNNKYTLLAQETVTLNRFYFVTTLLRTCRAFFGRGEFGVFQ